MASVLRNTQSLIVGTYTSTPTVTKPTGTVAGDILVALICGDQTGRPSLTLPSGWVSVYGTNDPDLGGSAWQYVAYKVATSSEPSSYTFTLVGGSGFGDLSLVIAGYYESTGVGTWSVITSGANTVDSDVITSPTLTGNGLYITSFLNDSPDAVISDNSPVANIFGDETYSLGLWIYGGDYNATNHNITVTWDGDDDLYSNNVIFLWTSGTPPPTGYASEIKIGSAYKGITNGYVAVGSNWKELQAGFIATKIKGALEWKEIFKVP